MRNLTHRTRWVVAAGLAACAVAALVLAVVGTGSGAAAPRALTADEANRLAITRFRNYETGGRAVRITVPDAAGGVVVTASVDFRAKRAAGELHGNGRNSSSDGFVRWNLTSLSVAPIADASAWNTRPLQPTGSALDTALRIAIGLGSDRPDNAQLLPQNGATRIGQDTVNGHQVEIMTGPAARNHPGTDGTVRYSLGPDGTMYRVQLTVASEPHPLTIDFDTQPYIPPPN
ncbi:hypothetical protein [Kribbella sp. NPDC004536]|uniref:hypothetical protein n=1 Tax=Kribbella sp. NPDC004536 TaxID=3364106 RepID=UPI0036C20ACD